MVVPCTYSRIPSLLLAFVVRDSRTPNHGREMIPIYVTAALLSPLPVLFVQTSALICMWNFD